jgi:hypothetical protein
MLTGPERHSLADQDSPTQVKCLFVPTGRKAFKCGQQKSEYFRIDPGDKEREHTG